jgi:peptide-methionine (R)-S-oxide reductase
MADKIRKSDEEWRAALSDQEFDVSRRAGTERAFSGEYWDCKDSGTYNCRCCGAPLFDSETKYDSGSGWPSFDRPVEPSQVEAHEDVSLGTRRVEVACARCDAHLGHVFPDGPPTTGLRYCINSASIDLERREEE